MFQALYFIYRNKVDFILVFFLSSLMYHWQVIYGQVWVPPYTFPVNVEAIYIVLIVMMVLQFFAIINDILVKNIPNIEYRVAKDREQYSIVIILICISWAATAYSLAMAGDKILLGKGEYLAAERLRYNFITYYPAAMALVYGTVARRKNIILLSLIPLLVYLVIGYRAVFVTAIVGVLAVHFYGQKLFSKKIIKLGIFVILLFTFFVLYKFSYVAIKAGEFDFFAHIIQKDSRFNNLGEFILYAMFSTEFGQVSSNLVLSSAKDLSQSYNFSDAFFGSITLLNNIIGYNEDMTRFSRVLRIEANPGFSYGLGSTFWGEMYQAGSYVGVLLMATIIIGLLTFFNISFRSDKERFPLYLYFVAFLSFYVHRNDYVLVVGNLKNIIFLIILAYIILLFLKRRIKVLPSTKSYFIK